MTIKEKNELLRKALDRLASASNKLRHSTEGPLGGEYRPSVEWQNLEHHEKLARKALKDTEDDALDDLREELAGLEAAFDMAGGRGVELANRIDELRDELEAAQGEQRQ